MGQDPGGSHRNQRLIGQVASQTGLSRQTIRRFDEAGLLHPTRTAGGFRTYLDQDVRRLVMVRQMQPLGFTVGERTVLIDVITRLEAGGDPIEHRDLLARLQHFIADAERRREVLRDRITAVDQFIGQVRSALVSAPA